MPYTLRKEPPSVEDALFLKEEAGWVLTNPVSTQKGFANSLFCVSVYDNEQIVGMARVVGDGFTVFYLQDVIVRPPYQHQGIASRMLDVVMSYIAEHACPGAIVGLMSAPGKEGLYERYGFWRRPVGHHGHGMMQYWQMDYR